MQVIPNLADISHRCHYQVFGCHSFVIMIAGVILMVLLVTYEVIGVLEVGLSWGLWWG